jgi:hypothetical protein
MYAAGAIVVGSSLLLTHVSEQSAGALKRPPGAGQKGKGERVGKNAGEPAFSAKSRIPLVAFSVALSTVVIVNAAVAGRTGSDRQSRALRGTVLLKQETGRLESRAERGTARRWKLVYLTASHMIPRRTRDLPEGSGESGFFQEAGSPDSLCLPEKRVPPHLLFRKAGPYFRSARMT